MLVDYPVLAVVMSNLLGPLDRRPPGLRLGVPGSVDPPRSIGAVRGNQLPGLEPRAISSAFVPKHIYTGR
jgi:hypothetical protein